MLARKADESPRLGTRFPARALRGLLLLILGGIGACSPTQGNDLTKMQKARITIKGEVFEVWIARTEAEREKGLMFVTAEQLGDTPEGVHRGMLFLFEQQKPLGFWMKNTITALDIAYINTDKTIVKTHTMKPLDESTYPSERPARYALEVKAQLFKSLHIASGDLVDIPDDVLKESP